LIKPQREGDGDLAIHVDDLRVHHKRLGIRVGGLRDEALAETLTLGDALDFQSRISAREQEHRLRELFAFTMKMADEYPSTDWVSPRSWEQSGSLYGVSIRGKESNQLFGQMYESHGFVFRPFNTQGLDSVRLSPNVFNTEDQIVRFFEIATA